MTRSTFLSGGESDGAFLERRGVVLLEHPDDVDVPLGGEGSAVGFLPLNAFLQAVRIVADAHEQCAPQSFSAVSYHEVYLVPYLLHTEVRLVTSGVPFFLVDEKYGISGAQSPEAFASAVGRVLELRQTA